MPFPMNSDQEPPQPPEPERSIFSNHSQRNRSVCRNLIEVFYKIAEVPKQNLIDDYI